MTHDSKELLAPAIRNHLLRELGKLTSYLDNDCQGDSPAKEYARHVAEGRKIQVEKLLNDPNFRSAANAPQPGMRASVEALDKNFRGTDICFESGMPSILPAASPAEATKPAPDAMREKLLHIKECVDLWFASGKSHAGAIKRTCNELAALSAPVPPPDGAADQARLEWLQERVVDTIYLDDGKIVDVKGGDLRKAIDAAKVKWPNSLEDDDGNAK